MEKKKTEEKNLREIQLKLEEERNTQDLKKMQVKAGLIKETQEKVEWMYAGPAAHAKKVEPDAYLMGKPLEKDKEANVVKEVCSFFLSTPVVFSH